MPLTGVQRDGWLVQSRRMVQAGRSVSYAQMRMHTAARSGGVASGVNGVKAAKRLAFWLAFCNLGGTAGLPVPCGLAGPIFV
ncbi:hypothetical protein D5272_12855 [bacterium D16-76]|nr:hypothetical protein [bacterium D16-76]